MKQIFARTAMAVCLATCAAAANATPFIYSYSGANFSLALGNYSTANHVTGSVTLNGPLAANFTGFLAPTAFSFNDGVQTISTANLGSGTSLFQFTTDAAGAISSYKVTLQTASLNSITVENDSARRGDLVMNYLTGSSLGSVYVAGAFTPQLGSAVPEPMTWALMIVGFGGVGAVLRRRAVVAGKAAVA